MALKTCKECGKEISTKADKCPNCGAPIKKKSQVGCLGAVIIIIFVLILIGWISNLFEESREEKRKIEEQKIAAELQKKKEEERRIAAKKQEQQKQEFVNLIEEHYQSLLGYYNTKDFENAAKKLDLFVTHNKRDYKDVEKMYREVSIWELEKKVRPIPASNISENLRLYKLLLELDPDSPKYKQKVAYYSTKMEAKREETRREQYKKNCDLELLNWHWSTGHGYAKAEGQVKNISGRKLKNVEALVIWFDNNGNMITSDSSLIEYNPIMPGQTSPFSVMEQYNPAMTKARVEFKYLFGGSIQTYREK